MPATFQDLSKNDKILFIVFKIFLHLQERKGVFFQKYILVRTIWINKENAKTGDEIHFLTRKCCDVFTTDSWKLKDNVFKLLWKLLS